MIGVIVAAALTLMGCKEVLYSDLDENQANEMVSALAASGISASRERDKKGIYSVLVEPEHVATSVTLLKNQGLPRERFETLGQVFSADGIVGTPFEQQARYLHAMNQELSHTVTSIGGIRSARVLVTAPPRGRYDQEPPAASASVVIHHEPDFQKSEYVSVIKTIVAHSLPNLSYDSVAVAMFPAGGPAIVPESVQPVAALSGETPITKIQTVMAEWQPASDVTKRLLIVLILVGVAAIALILRNRLAGREKS